MSKFAILSLQFFVAAKLATGMSVEIQPTATLGNQLHGGPVSIFRTKRQVPTFATNPSSSAVALASQCGIMQCCRQLTSCVPIACGLDAQTCAVLEFNMLVGQLGQFRPGAIFPGAALVPPATGTTGATLYHLPGALRAEVLYTPRSGANALTQAAGSALQPSVPAAAAAGLQRYAPFSSAYGTVVFDQTSTIVISDIPVNRRIQTYVLQQAQPTPAQLTFINYGAMTDIANRLNCGPFTVAALSPTVVAPGTTIVRTVPQVIRPLANTVLPATCSGLLLPSQQLSAVTVASAPSSLPAILPTTAAIGPSAVGNSPSSLAAAPSVYPLTSNAPSSTTNTLSSLLTTTVTVTVTPTSTTATSSSGPPKSTTIPPGKVAIRFSVITASPS